MSAYEIKLEYHDTPPGHCAHIIARDPLRDFEFPIAPMCVSFVELQYELNRIRKALDHIERQGRRKFEKTRQRVLSGEW